MLTNTMSLITDSTIWTHSQTLPGCRSSAACPTSTTSAIASTAIRTTTAAREATRSHPYQRARGRSSSSSMAPESDCDTSPRFRSGNLALMR